MMFADTEKCKRCGACFAECPYDLIVEDSEGFPKIRLAAKKTCIACGHCVAVCPTEAIVLPKMPMTESLGPEQCAPLLKDLDLTGEQVDQFLRGRRSIRSYKDKPIPETVVSHLFDISRFAPSAKNGQPARWIVKIGRAHV